MKHFKEDSEAESGTEKTMTRKAERYARKIEKRHLASAMTPSEFLTDPALIDKDIWELRYASTSDEDDNDEEDSSEYDSEEEEKDSSEDEAPLPKIVTEIEEE